MKKVFIILFFASLICTSSILYSQQGWFVQHADPTADFYRVYMIDSFTGWVISYDTMYYTSNSGTNWITRIFGNSGKKDIFFINPNTGWISGMEFIIKTTNSGVNWFEQYSGYIQDRIYFVDENTGFTIAGTLLCRRTTNGGNNWTTFTIGSSSYALFTIDFVNHDTGFIGGQNGLIYKTTNCGLNWVLKNTGVNTRFYGLSYTTTDTAWAGGFNNYGDSKLIFTSTGGETWVTKYTDPVSQGIENIFFITAKEGWVVGLPGKIMHTTDAGNTWEFQNSNAGNIHLLSVYFVTSKTGWIAGEAGSANGKILKTTTGGVVPVTKIGTNTPQNISLLQNYPNPFNIITIISYELPFESEINLNIYDVLGRLVQTLVSKKQKTGKYQVTWDAGNCSSGLYYYTLRTGDFTETKKMILIK